MGARDARKSRLERSRSPALGIGPHLALDKDAPDLRPIARPEAGTIVEVPEAGGLHHRYLRRAA
jgi:hypothetical protein